MLPESDRQQAVEVTIRRYLDDSQPGWVECAFLDAHGQEHIFREKVPVVSLEELDSTTAYPRPGSIGCEVLQRWKDEAGRELVSVDTERPWGCESVDGLTVFEVLPGQLRLAER